MAIVRDSSEGALLTVHVQPGAKRTEYAGLHGDALKFRVSAPPIEGAANEVLCDYLSKQFGLSKRSAHILSGQSSRRKLVLLRGLSASRVAEVFSLPAAGVKP